MKQQVISGPDDPEGRALAFLKVQLAQTLQDEAESDNSLTFFVPGTPRTKQSFRAYVTEDGRIGGHKDPVSAEWQAQVTRFAGLAMRLTDGKIPGDVGVSLTFFLPDRHTRDIDNLEKAVLDGLKGVVFLDDKQVTDSRKRLVFWQKYEWEPFNGWSDYGVLIHVYKVPDQTQPRPTKKPRKL